MKFQNLKTNKNTTINGPLLLKPTIYEDNRGYFYESWNQSAFNKALDKDIIFIQDNISISRKGVVRGLHFQINPKPQGKLITCRKGSIFDVAVDLRESSNTFGYYCSAYLDEENKDQLWIPNGFAHGFMSLSDNTEVQYKVQGSWDTNCERSIKWDDPDLCIDWPIIINKIDKIILSRKDSIAPSFKSILKSGDFFS